MPLPQDVMQSLVTLLTSLNTLQAPPTSDFPHPRFYSAIFRQLPDKTMYPDYYIFIKEPRSLDGVMESIKRGIYSSPAAVGYDLFLIWSNARQYNAEGSVVYNDANVLQSAMKKLWKERTPPLPPWKSLLRPQDMVKAPKKHKESSSTATAARGSTTAPAPATALPPTSLPPTAFVNSTALSTTAPAATSSSFPKLKLSFGGGGSAAALNASGPPQAAPTSHAPTSSTSSTAKSQIPPRNPNKMRPDSSKPKPLSTPTSTAATSALQPQASPATQKPGGLTLKLSVKPPVASSPAPPTLLAPSMSSHHKIPAVSSPNLPPSLSMSNLPPIKATSAPMKLNANVSATNTPPLGSLPSLPPLPPAPTASGLGTPTAAHSRKRPSEAGLAQGPSAKKGKDDKQVAASRQASVGVQLPPTEIDTGWFAADVTAQKFADIVRKIRVAKHVEVFNHYFSGRTLSESLPPSCVTSSETSIEPTLQSIEAKVASGQFTSPDHFDRELQQLFKMARQQTRSNEDEKVRSDVMVLQRYYHELTRYPPGPVPSLPLDPKQLSTISYGPGNKGENPIVESKVMLKQILFKGDTLKTGDWVHLLNPDNPARPIVAQIFKVFRKADTGRKYVSACWYYRPEETIHPATRQFYEHEVFKTNNFHDHAVEDIIERAFVMYFTRYTRGRPKATHWTPDVSMYVCEHRYKEDVRSFKRIKNWLTCIPEDVRKREYPLEKWADGHVDQLKQFPSPFLSGVEGPGHIGESLEAVEDDQAKFHVLPTGQQATPSALRAAEQVKRQRAQQEEALAAAAAAAASAVPSAFSNAYSPAAGSFVQHDAGTEQDARMLLTPAEMAVQVQSFAPLPAAITSKFRSDGQGDMLWFTAPAATHSVVDDDTGPLVPWSSLAHVKRPVHSLEYLYWRAVNA
ncbi:hypothetical protein OIO90_002650 [Microbotryomycetes sp. JL221]|nr:hypothetical protein OIO90_002650 [Microbotryomycetes sp. JL221]